MKSRVFGPTRVSCGRCSRLFSRQFSSANFSGQRAFCERWKGIARTVQKWKSIARCKNGKVLHGSKAMQVPPGAQVRAILRARLGPFEFKTGPIWVHIAAGQAYFTAMALFTARRSAFLRCNICQADEGEVGELEQIGFNCMHCLFTKGGVALQIIVSQYIWWLDWIFKSSEK